MVSYDNIKIENVKGHYEITCDGKFIGSEDTYHEAEMTVNEFISENHLI